MEARERLEGSWKDLAESIGVDAGSMQEWKEERQPLPEIAYQRLKWDRSYDAYIQEVLRAAGTQRHLRMPEKSAELAEFMGAIMGDGNISRIRGKPKVVCYEVRIAGHGELDYDYLKRHLGGIASRLFGLAGKMRFHHSKDHNCVYLTFSSKDLVEFLEQMGAPVGNKMEQFLEIPDWVIAEDAFLRAYIRGLFDTDGSVFRMSNKDPQLLRIGLTSYNHSLIYDVRAALRNLGFHPSKPTNHERRIYLSRKADVRKYLKEIGFANDKHKRRLAQFTAP